MAERQAAFEDRTRQRFEESERIAEIRNSRFERRIGAIQELIRIGMRQLVETDRRIDTLVKAQLETEAALSDLKRSMQAFLDSLRPSGNGNLQ